MFGVSAFINHTIAAQSGHVFVFMRCSCGVVQSAAHSSAASVSSIGLAGAAGWTTQLDQSKASPTILLRSRLWMFQPHKASAMRYKLRSLEPQAEALFFIEAEPRL
jgi:hypothetical protein